MPLYPDRWTYPQLALTSGENWTVDIPSLRITDSKASEATGPLVVRAQDFANSDAGGHAAVLTRDNSDDEHLQCRYMFWLKRGTKLAMTQRSDDDVHLTGRLSRSRLGPEASMLGYAGQSFQIHRTTKGRHNVVVKTLTTDSDGRFAATVPNGPYRWEADYGGNAQTVSIFAFATPS